MLKNKSLFWLYCLSAAVYFGQGVESLTNLPVFFFMKETLHLDQSRIMYLTSWITVAWLLKPIIGHFVDNLGISKKMWVLFSLIGTASVACVVGLLPVLPIVVLIALMALSSSFGAVRDVATDGLMCVAGKKEKTTGRIQAIQWISLTVAVVITGFLGGYIAEHYSYKVAFCLLIPIYLFIIGVLSFYKSVEKPKRLKLNILQTLKVLVTDKKLLLVCLLIFLYKFSPSFGIPLTFIMKDKFGWTPTFIGIQDTIGSVVGIVGAVLYYKFSKKIDMIKWLKISVFVGAVVTLAYLYFTPITAIIYNVVFGCIGMFVTLLLLDFMARNTRPGMESTSFALLCSVSNLAATCNGFTGSFLFPIVGLNWLIVISAVASFSCLLVIPYLKKENTSC